MSVRVENGVNSIQSEFEGKTIREIRAVLRQALNIDAHAAVYANGDRVTDESYTAKEGDEIEFVKAAGTKGFRPRGTMTAFLGEPIDLRGGRERGVHPNSNANAMKVIKIDARPDLEALIKDLYSNGESEPIFLEDKGKQVAVIVSPAEYRTLRRVEEVLSDRLDVEESEEILKDPKWISWDALQKQLKS